MNFLVEAGFEAYNELEPFAKKALKKSARFAWRKAKQAYHYVEDRNRYELRPARVRYFKQVSPTTADTKPPRIKTADSHTWGVQQHIPPHLQPQTHHYKKMASRSYEGSRGWKRRRVIRGGRVKAKRSIYRRWGSSKKYMANANTRTAGFLGVEHKFYDVTFSGAITATSTACAGAEFNPSVTSLISTPPTGDGPSARDGFKMVIESVYIKGIVRRGAIEDAASVAGLEQLYLCLVLDTQTNGANMNSEDCFVNPSGNLNTVVMPLKNLLMHNRFKIIDSQYFDMTPMELVSITSTDVERYHANPILKTFAFYKKWKKGLHVRFNAGTTADVANVIDNSLHIIALSNSATGSVLTLTYHSRIRFQG